jgi:hypothetical protein
MTVQMQLLLTMSAEDFTTIRQALAAQSDSRYDSSIPDEERHEAEQLADAASDLYDRLNRVLPDRF